MTSGQKKREDKRFHGAFTGGFSAGYFNSVGSKEGWTPSTFQSSRSQPQASSEGGDAPKPRTQRIEDFMDEEDDPLLGRRLGLNAQFDPLAGDAASQQQFQARQAATASIPGFIVDDFIQPSRSTIGTTLLGKMGWKPGQGVGPKVRKRKFASRFSGNDAASTADADDTILVAPKHTLNIADIFPSPKLDKYGVGYDPYVNAPEFGFLQRRRQLEASHAASGGPPRAMLTFAASIRADNTAPSSMSLGLSALEEADDLDVYAMDSKDSFDRVLAKQPSRAMLMAPPADDDDAEDESATSQVCSDGSTVLTGFRLSSTRPKPASVLVAHVVVPPNWRPSLQHLKLAPPRKQTAHSAADRGRALGEVAQPPKPEPERQLLHSQFRAGMMAAISSRFQSSSAATADESSAAAPLRQVMEPLARRTKAWLPDRLLCKRFRLSVPDAAVGDAPPSAKPTPDHRFENDIMAHIPAGAGVARPANGADAAVVLPDLPPLERPTLDLFQAVFDDNELEDDDDSSSSSEEEVDAPTPPPPQRTDQARPDPPRSMAPVKPPDASKRRHDDSSSDSDRRRKKKHKSKKDHKQAKKDRKKHKKHHRS